MQPAPYPYSENVSLTLSDNFNRRVLANGRKVVQLTMGEAFCYPLYYYIPSLSKDLKYLVYHRAEKNEVQLHRLDLGSGESVQLTHGTTGKTGWDNWDDEAGRGILDHRSVLNVATGEVVYFAGENGKEVCSVNLETLVPKSLFDLPDEYYAGGQNCISPDGKYLVYIANPVGSKYLEPLPDKPSKVMAFEFSTGEQKTLCEVFFHIHHVIPYGNEHFIGCHTPNGCGIFMTDLSEGGVTILRAGDPGLKVSKEDTDIGGHACHYLSTEHGIAYEVIPFAMEAPKEDKSQKIAEVKGGFHTGLYDPISRKRFEFPLPDHFVGTHVGWDPKGRRWFWEIMPSWDQASANKLVYLRRIESSGKAEFMDLTPEWMNFGSKQKSHHHPQLTPDPNWLLFVAGDPASETNHILLLDVSDLPETEGVGPELLSSEGVNDIAQLHQ
jgi:hypothetical protein